MSAIIGMPVLKGQISADRTLSGSLASVKTLAGRLSVVKDHEKYDGDYSVTPAAFSSQTLETADKILKENITINEVPYYETNNEYGNTVYIGKEV